VRCRGYGPVEPGHHILRGDAGVERVDHDERRPSSGEFAARAKCRARC
jgi:hypothetical protein